MSSQAKIYVFVLFIIATLSLRNAIASPPIQIGKGCTTAFSIDTDCDGYGVGVGYVAGPDADDTDSTVNTTTSVNAKYGNIDSLPNLTSYMSARGYHWSNTINDVYYISPSGDNNTGKKNDPMKPYLNYEGIKSSIAAGDLVLLRGGTHTEGISTEYGVKTDGAMRSPIIIMSYPGELATITATNSVRLYDSEWFVIDNIRAIGTGYTFHNHYLDNVDFRYIEASGGIICHRMMAVNNNVLLENSVVHSSTTSHAIYWGNNGLYGISTNLTMRGVICYNGSGTEQTSGMQHNGPVTGILIEDCIFHSHGSNGPSLLNGAQQGIIRNNLFFNINGHSFVLDNYYTSYTSRNIENIKIINNTFWMGRYNNGNGSKNPWERACIMMVDRDSRAVYTFTDIVIRNNIFEHYGNQETPGALLFKQIRHATGTTFENNIHHRYDGHSTIASAEDTPTTWTIPQFEASGNNKSGNYTGDPLFQDVSVDYYLTPSQFNFDLSQNSPATSHGTLTGAPIKDLREYDRLGNPDAGCYESFYDNPPKAPTGLR